MREGDNWSEQPEEQRRRPKRRKARSPDPDFKLSRTTRSGAREQ